MSNKIDVTGSTEAMQQWPFCCKGARRLQDFQPHCWWLNPRKHTDAVGLCSFFETSASQVSYTSLPTPAICDRKHGEMNYKLVTKLSSTHFSRIVKQRGKAQGLEWLQRLGTAKMCVEKGRPNNKSVQRHNKKQSWMLFAQSSNATTTRHSLSLACTGGHLAWARAGAKRLAPSFLITIPSHTLNW